MPRPKPKLIAIITVTGIPMKLMQSRYIYGGGIALDLLYQEEGLFVPFLGLTVNFPNCPDIGCGEFAVKTYSENTPYIADIFASGLFEDTGKSVSGGYATSMPIWKFKEASSDTHV